MPDLTFGEQVKIVLGRKGMTIKELAEMIEQRTGKKMSRQNLTQRLGRDNFQEQDMRMIASILECPFRLDILGEDTPDEADREAVEREIAAIEAENQEEASQEEEKQEETNQEEEREESQEEEKQEEQEEKYATDAQETERLDTDETETAALTQEDAKEESTGRDITVGEFLEIRKSSGESAQEQLMQELLAEMDSIEREDRERDMAWERRRRKKERQEAEKKAEKKGGWMSHFPFRRREEQPEPEEYFDEESTADELTEEENADIEEAGEETDGQEEVKKKENTFSERIKEYTGQDNDYQEQIYEEDEEEDLEAGDVNPYTGREYFSNSVRMHPKRIGYVQVYNRKDHKWSDMTEWAFLGYQERKKMLLGRDYEPPIYLD
ncbi:hypothetical protein C818_01217 [Lachnospiraceae bacterium MD308]|nr:hypothetical protein C818_01217 [Lachnospiraceae bacterium MD308]